MSRTPTEAQGPSPVLGVHTDDVLREAGLPAEMVEQLRATGAIGDRRRAPPSTAPAGSPAAMSSDGDGLGPSTTSTRSATAPG
jgi:hypothetical protein